MKKLFTLLTAILFVSMCFAQTGKYAVTGVPEGPQDERSTWYGYYTQSGYVHTQPAESEYVLYMPANTITTDFDITKVRFYSIPSENINNYTGDPFTLETFQIRIYLDPTVNGHEITLGTPVATQTYDASEAEAGVQLVDLTTPYHVTAGHSVAVGIYCEELSSMGLVDDDPSCASINFAYWPDYGEGYHHYYWTAGNPAWAYEGATVREHDPWNLSFFYNDGGPVEHICDWHSYIWNPENMTTDEEIDHLIVDNYTDSLWFYGGFYNGGPDSSISNVTVDIYVNDANLGTVYFYQDEPWGQYDIDTLEINYGWKITANGPIALMSAEEFENMSLPFEMCVNVHPNFPEGSGFSDPNMDNNLRCIQVGREEDFIGIDENTNTLVVFPNPANNFITLENAAGADITVYNITGQEVMNLTATQANQTLNVSGLSEGLYVVRVANGNEVATCKVSVVR